ncbi:MAG TPA: ABC transporter permease [Vicinamibacterales bacterium]|nr:ABC transporter permease [Vicinamibacterales bacterium]
MRTWWRLAARVLFRRDVVEQDLDDEMHGFVEELVQRRVGKGMPREEARRQVLAEAGSVAAVKDAVRDVLPGLSIDTWLKDVQWAWRALCRQPMFAAVIVLTLSIGIGANTAIFSLIDAIGWRPLPVRDPQRLLLVARARGSVVETGFTYQQFRSMRSAGVVDLEGYSSSAFPVPVTLDAAGIDTVDGVLVSGGYFSRLGLAPSAGRLIAPEDDRRPGDHPVAVISHGFWQTRFGGLPSAVGQRLSLNSVTFTIVGVAPRGFSGIDVGRAPVVYVPMAMQREVMPVVGDLIVEPTVNRTWVQVIARSHDGIAPHQIATALQAAYLDGVLPILRSTAAVRDTRLSVEPIPRGVSEVRTQFTTGLLILWALVATVLLLACANIANLLLTRADARRSEFALRLSLGAGRWRLARQLVFEHLLLSFTGGVLGLALAYWSTSALVRAMRANDAAVILDVSPRPAALVFTSVVAIATAVIFGLVPLTYALRTDLVIALKRVTGARSNARATPARVLAVCQVALSVLLLAGAGLFVRNLQKLYALDNLDREHVFVARVEPRGSNQRGTPGTSERLDGLYRSLMADIRGIPGVMSASLGNVSPTKADSGAGVLVPNRPNERLRAAAQVVYPDFFRTVGIRMVAGRDFTEADNSSGATACIANRAFVALAYPNQNPLGQPCYIGRGVTYRIVGVVDDVRFTNARGDAVPTIYSPFLPANTGRGQMVLYVRVTNPSAALAGEIANRLRGADSTVPQYPVRTLREELDSVLTRERLMATLSSTFGIIALIVAAVGLYGLLSFSIARRTGELALRMVLGALPRVVAVMVLQEAGALVLTGLLVGAVLTLASARLASGVLSSVLFSVSPLDGPSLVGAVVVLLMSAGLAAAIPAFRAARIAPMVALRAEQE